MASSSSKRKRKYDVVLSFRGIDVRKTFLSHLNLALNQNGLFTYIDNKEMRKGQQIWLELMKVIEESHVAIIIFSKNYASSWWCLEEVAKIMECMKQKDLIVLPVFYKVEPREVRKWRGSYGRALAKHESEFGKDSYKVKRWKEALVNAGNLSGWHVKDEVEAKLIKEIVNEISMQLDRRPLHIAKHLVGIHPQVIKLNSMLKLESRDDIRMIGLWGPGGIGKTTLSLELYNNNYRQFEGSCFLADVRKASKEPKGLVALQEILLSEILPGQKLVVSSSHRGINLMQDRLCRKEVLLVLDDVNDKEQLDALVGEPGWFGEGSRIIIITRNKYLLTSHGIDEDHIYEVKPLEYYDALELLNKHAFQRNNKKIIRKDLVNMALHYANGLPLALKVLGCSLVVEENIINDALKWSYDGLEDHEKEIFLDIACFFEGQSKEYIMRVLDSWDFDPTIVVQVLVEKSLIIEERERSYECVT
ncbi:hypothetical protein EUGRSUZ_H02170 [Eucalyptus grandis]|uniref:TIR domain-containing protein n=2 Tax=Eucalyptus grandis TaxID=71139 RepID=A0A059AZR4_EUCGR|nr:hypothetical protein EUGRSUZ_H02170 [Eucalyptus grandis]